MLKWIANLLYQYGVFGAGIPSHHGTYESVVPEKLRFGID